MKLKNKIYQNGSSEGNNLEEHDMEHGGNVLSYEKAVYEGIVDSVGFSFSPPKIIDFSAGINPFGLSKNAVKIIKNYRLVKFFTENYPEVYNETLISTISAYHNIAKEYIFLGAGATDLIFNAAQLFRPKTVIIAEPSFLEYERAAAAVKSAIFHINTEHTEQFNLSGTSYESLLRDIETVTENDLVFIANPSNPAGAITSLQNIKRILAVLRGAGAFLILDESFIDFCEEFSAKELVTEHDNLIIIRSLTKFFAMPGQRLGYIIANDKIIQKFSEYIMPWKITNLAAVIADISLKDKEYIANTRLKLKKIKANLLKGLKIIEELEVIPGKANYFLIKIKSKRFNGLDLKDYLLKSGILIRYCGNYRGLNVQYFRIAVKNRRENNFLMQKLKEFIAVYS